MKADLKEDETSFREMIAANKTLATDKTTQDVLARVEAPLLTYIDSATNMVERFCRRRRGQIEGRLSDPQTVLRIRQALGAVVWLAAEDVELTPMAHIGVTFSSPGAHSYNGVMPISLS